MLPSLCGGNDPILYAIGSRLVQGVAASSSLTASTDEVNRNEVVSRVEVPY